MQTLVRDTFTAADGTVLENHAPDVGGLWAKVLGTVSATITSNTLRRASNAAPSFYVNTAARPRDFDMSCVASAIVGGSNGFIAHRQSNGDAYLAVYNSSTGAYEISTYVGGVITVIVSLIEAAPSLPATFMLRVRQGDEYLRLLVDSVEKVATNDQTLTGGLAGIYIQGFGGTTIIDDFVLEHDATAGELQGIVDELVLIQGAITAPDGQSGVKVYDEPPTGALTFPCFVNVESDIFDIKRESSLRSYSLTIDMHLLFARTDQKYNFRERRPWVKKVLDAFDGAVRLDNHQAPVQYAPIESVTFDNELDLPGDAERTYIAATFRLRAWLAEAFEFGA